VRDKLITTTTTTTITATPGVRQLRRKLLRVRATINKPKLFRQNRITRYERRTQPFVRNKRGDETYRSG